ncbi:hypothetical protein ACWDUD_19045 [Rhodococcus sp. NPDC003382]
MPDSSPSPRPRAPRRWERFAVVGLAAVVAAVALLVLFTPDDTSPRSGPVDRAPEEIQASEEIQALLDTWAAAVRAADADTLRTLVDDRARPGFLDAELRRAAAVAQVPLSDWGYELGNAEPAPVPADVAARLGDAKAQTRTVYLRYAIEGIDAEPTRKPVTVVVVRRDDGWRLVDDEPGPGRVTWRGPWDFGPLVVEPVPQRSGGRSLVIGHPEQEELVDAIAREMEPAVGAVDRIWGTDWSRRAVVLVTSSHDEFTHQVGDRHNGAGIAAVAVSDAVDPRAGSATGQRIVFSPAAADRLDAEGLRTVLRHELTHIAARADTVDGSPLWMLEGYADYIGYLGADEEFDATAPTLTAAVTRNGTPAALPEDAEFTDERSLLAYETAWSLAAYTADDYGPARLTELYRRLARGPIDGAQLDAVLTDVLGTDTGTFVAAWGSWVDDRLAASTR